jgi:cytochrome c553
MAQTKRASWIALVTLSATLVSTHATQAEEATAAPAQKKLPFEDGSAQEGATKAAVCTACHGANGNSTNPEWPVLAGQNAVYIDQQLRLFRAGVRNNPVMMPMAQALSDKDISDLAVYFSAQTPAGGESDPSYWKAGQTLYRNGDVTRSVPACVACHGPVGRGNVAAGYPALRTQHSVYTVKQLTDYATGARYSGATADKDKQPGPNHAMMATIAKRLTPEDIRNVASYIQGMR